MTNMTMKEAFDQYPDLSLRKVAMALDLNYNMLLKKGKEPVPGIPYDPELINFTSVEIYIRKKLGDKYDDVEWDAINEINAGVARKKKEEIVWAVGDKLTIRGSDATYEVHMATETHIVIMEVGGTQPRVFSWNTFEHQTPRKVAQGE